MEVWDLPHHRRPRAARLWGITPLRGQAIEFESNGLRYQTLTRDGVTIMFAPLPAQVRDYVVLQLAVSNGSPSSRTIKAEDFRFIRADGTVITATPAGSVVQQFLNKGGRSDVIKLVGTYEMSLYGLSRLQSTNGYGAAPPECARRGLLLQTESRRRRIRHRLRHHQAHPLANSTTAPSSSPPRDALSEGKLVARVGASQFEFAVGGLKHPGELIKRP